MSKISHDTTLNAASPIASVGIRPQGELQRSTTARRHINIIRELAIADFRLKYHDSALGYIWSMLNPMFMFGVYYFVFTRIFHSEIPLYPLFLLTGIISYAFFQDCTFSAMNSLSSKSGIMKKIFFPKTIIVFSSSLTCVFSYLINLGVLILLVAVMKGFSPLALLIVVPIFCLFLFSVGVAFLLSTLYAFFRDMGQIWNVLVLVIFWLSPVVFNVETLPEPVSTLVYFNPLTRIFVLMRHYLLYDYFDLRFVTMTVVYSSIFFLSGYFLFRRYEHKFAELF
jgi:ABC-type polysaccharide/polyol phosphate export permease